MVVTAVREREVEQRVTTFGSFRVGLDGARLAIEEISGNFGADNYNLFRGIQRRGGVIPEEEKQRGDREMYDVAGILSKGRSDWESGIALASGAFAYARDILFPDQDRRSRLHDTVALSDNRPSTALAILTAPTREHGPHARYAQGLQLGLTKLALEVLSEEDRLNTKGVLNQIKSVFEEHLYVGQEGQHTVIASHEPHTNKLLDVYPLNERRPDFYIQNGVWVRCIDFPVHTIALRDASGNIMSTVPALVEFNEKGLRSSVIKATQ